jgi:hypothetical protein
MKEFYAAAQATVDEEQGEEKVLEFSLAGQEFVARIPTTGQVALVAGSGGRSQSDMIGAVFGFFRGVLLDDGWRRLHALLEDGTVPFEVLFGGDDNNATGVVEWISTAAGGERPTQPSRDSSPSPDGTGRKSTGRSPGKGSTRSTSLSAVS